MKHMRQVRFLVALYQRGITESSVLSHRLKSPMNAEIEKKRFTANDGM